MPSEMPFPLSLGYDNETNLDELLTALRPTVQEYMKAEVLPHVPDAWVDESKTKLGFEIPINRHFYEYQPPRDLAVIKTKSTLWNKKSCKCWVICNNKRSEIFRILQTIIVGDSLNFPAMISTTRYKNEQIRKI